MELTWPRRRCILCKREPADDVTFSRAHLIPASVGGFVWAWTMCADCNSRCGSKIEADVVEDESVRMAVDALASELPDLASVFAERRTYFAETPHGKVKAGFKDGRFELLPTTDEAGTLFTSRRHARNALDIRLRREGHREGEISAALDLVDQAPTDETFTVGNHTVTHRDVEGFQPMLDGEFVSDAFPSLIAFHFLAIAMGANAYDHQLDGLRGAIREGQPSSKWQVAERLIERPYRPQHLIGLSQTEPYVIVRVQLFGWNVWRVHFPRIASKSQPHGIMLDLKTQNVRPAKPKRPTQMSRPPGGVTEARRGTGRAWP